jgi:hypothetical protein
MAGQPASTTVNPAANSSMGERAARCGTRLVPCCPATADIPNASEAPTAATPGISVDTCHSISVRFCPPARGADGNAAYRIALSRSAISSLGSLTPTLIR